MKKQLISLSTLFFLAITSAFAQYSDYTKLPSGLIYKIWKDAPGSKFAIEDMVITLHIKTIVKDQVLFDSYAMNSNEPVNFQVAKKTYNGDLMEGLNMLTPGDSAHFMVIADSLLKAGGQLPPNVVGTDTFHYYVNLVNVYTKEENKKMEEERGKMQLAKEDKVINDYIKEKKLKTQKTASGIHYIVTQKGNGKHPVATDKVKVHYKGYKLNGETFDSSIDRGEPIEFSLQGVIKGWTEGIPMFEEGGKGTLIIPSHLAYGKNAPPGSKIGPNEILLFDVEVLQIIK